MEYRLLGSTDLRVSRIGMGCVTFGREIDRDASFAVLDRALESGVTLFDTAEAYAAGRSEEVLGEWAASRGVRDRIVLATKVNKPLSRARIRSCAADSLRRLRTDRIDLYQLHAWDAGADLDEVLDALAELVREGTARHVGCSNFAAWQLARALWRQDVRGLPPMASIQPIYNLVHRGIERELLPLCADRRVGVLTYSPAGAGFLTGKYRRGGPVPPGTRFDIIPGHQPIYFSDRGFRVLECLESAARSAGVPMATLALAWALRQPGPTAVLVGARSTAHVDQALAAAELPLDMTELTRATSPEP